MHKFEFLFKKNILKLIILSISLLIAAFFINQSRYLRSLGYETIPDTRITDEYNYVWQAISLKKYGLPVAWTTFTNVYSNPIYHSQKGNLQGLGISVDGKIIDLKEFKANSKPLTAVSEIDWSKGLEHMYFVAPFFDHSSLGGLIYSLGVNKNISQFDQVKPTDFRKPALDMAIITAILLFIFILQITGKPLVAALATGIYSTVPTYIFATRGAFLENVVSPLILGHLILLLVSLNFIDRRRFRLAYLIIFLAGLTGGLGGLSKETAVGFLLGSLIIVFFKKIPRRYILILVAGIVLPFLIYIGWGLWLQKDLFIGIFLANSTRSDFGSLKLISMLESLRFESFPIDGWWIWGIVSTFLVGGMIKFSKNKYVYLILPFLCNFLILMFIGNSNYPWYWISMIPFFAGASAIVIGDLFENPKFLTLLVFFFLPFSSSFYWGYSVFHQNSGFDLNLYRGTFIILLVIYVIRKYLAKFKYIRYVWVIVLTLILFEIFKWNLHSIQYMVAHWGNLPVPSLPKM